MNNKDYINNCADSAKISLFRDETDRDIYDAVASLVTSVGFDPLCIDNHWERKLCVMVKLWLKIHWQQELSQFYEILHDY